MLSCTGGNAVYVGGTSVVWVETLMKLNLNIDDLSNNYDATFLACGLEGTSKQNNNISSSKKIINGLVLFFLY